MLRGWCSLLVCAASCFAQAPLTGELEVVSYNVHGLPGLVTGDDTLARLKAIGPKLEPFAIVGLQEDFVPEGHPLLERPNTFPARARFDAALAGRVYGSGLCCFARAKVLSTYTEHFRSFNGVFDGANDGLASKGFLLQRLELAPGVELDVYTSHLDAGGGREDAAARADQVTQLIRAMQTRSAGRAVLFLGDTNLKAKHELDARTLARWQKATGLRCACLASQAECCGRIDRVFVRSGAGLALEVRGWGVAPGFTDAKGQQLSDHEPIRATLRWTQRAL